jgi:hypothetical protein
MEELKMAKTVLQTIQNNGNKKFKIPRTPNSKERDVDIEVAGDEDDADFEVQKLSVVGLDDDLDGQTIEWFANFAINKRSTNHQPINQTYKVTITGLSAVRTAGKKIVILDSNAPQGKPYVFRGPVNNDTIELTDGDPAVGGSPP